MLTLAAATAIVQVVTGSPVSSIEVHASYADRVGTTVTATGANTVITTATTKTIVSSPAVGTIRNVKFLSVLNSSASSCSVSIQHFDGTNTSELFTITLLAGYAIHYTSDGRGFVVFDNLGRLLS